MILNGKKPGLTSMQEKKNLDILNDCSGKERKKKIDTHQK